MKIIAVVDATSYRRKFLAEVTDDELRDILGDRYGDKSKIDVGAEIQVSELYTRLRKFEDARADLQSAQVKLRAIADLIDPCAVVLTVPKPEEF